MVTCCKSVLTGSGLSLVSYKGLVAEALRQLVGEQNYKQDEVLAPGYYTGTTQQNTNETTEMKYYSLYCT